MSYPSPVGRPPARCSYCGEPIWAIEPSLMPFCSQRCKEIDLSKWLTESYGLPYEGEEVPESSGFSPHEEEP
ncbi:MAG: DNA gyrase inhibitor YacG [Planctomycetaceae bacterium]|nr:DNA gyrase inhibitor YacG [Planctomycetaceae bacterium]